MEFYDANFKRTVLSGGGVIFNCMGGCGRSGMFLMRLLLEWVGVLKVLWSVYESFDLARSKLNNKSFGLSSKAAKLEDFR